MRGVRRGRECETETKKKGKRVTQGQDSMFVPTGQQLSRENIEKKHKKKALNSYLPTLKKFESCTNVGDPVDPL